MRLSDAASKSPSKARDVVGDLACSEGGPRGAGSRPPFAPSFIALVEVAQRSRVSKICEMGWRQAANPYLFTSDGVPNLSTIPVRSSQ